MKGQYESKFDPEVTKKWSYATSRTCRCIAMLVSALCIVNVILVASFNAHTWDWGVPNWARYCNDALAVAVCLSLVVSLIILLGTLRKYLKGGMKDEMKTTRIQKFFVFFTMAYVYLTSLEVYASVRNWVVTGNPLVWPAQV